MYGCIGVHVCVFYLLVSSYLKQLYSSAALDTLCLKAHSGVFNTTQRNKLWEAINQRQ